MQLREFLWAHLHITLVGEGVIVIPWVKAQGHRIAICNMRTGEWYETGSFSNLWLWHADEKDDVLVTFEIDWDKHPAEVQQTKWSFKWLGAA